MAARRNIIFILIDDLRFDAMGFMRPEIRTPHIDRLAARGAHFANAFVTSSLCSPSRATILTGLSMRNHKVVDNNAASEDGLIFFPSYLQTAGYQTGFFGKWHFGSGTDAPRPGFDRWVSFKGQGAYFPTTYLPAEAIASGTVHQLNVDGRSVPQQGYITDELTDYALDWLSGRDPAKPFFLYLSHKAVHSMAMPAPRHVDAYKNQSFPVPESAVATPENDRGKPLWVRNQRNSWHGVDFLYHTGQPVSDYMRDYYTTLLAVDESVGRVLAWVEEQGLAQDTAIIFTSDNGYMEGEHGLIDKRNAYEESMRVPFLMAVPGQVAEGQRLTSCITSLDIAPTLLDLAGVAPPDHFEGRSILPLATGSLPADQWDDEVIYEYYWEWGFPMTPSTFAIRTHRYKYVQYHGVWDLEELYDLAADPKEMNNLINDPALLEIKIDLRKRLYAGLTDRDGGHAVPFTERTSSGAVFRRKGGTPAAGFPDDWLRTPDAPDLVEGLFPDSQGKLKRLREGRLPKLWTGKGS